VSREIVTISVRLASQSTYTRLQDGVGETNLDREQICTTSEQMMMGRQTTGNLVYGLGRFVACFSDRCFSCQMRRSCEALASKHTSFYLFLQVRSGRRAARIGTIEIDQRARTISPFAFITEMGAVNDDSPSDTRSTGASTTVRRQMETQLHAVQEKMVNLEDIEGRTSSGSDSLGRHRIMLLCGCEQPLTEDHRSPRLQRSRSMCWWRG
jgi:hypothetical protein